MFTFPVQIRFNDVDLLGHLNNGAYLAFMDLAKAHFFKHILGDKVDWHNINLAIVNINVNFFAPGFLDSDLVVETSVESVGVHSVVLLQRIIDLSRDNKLLCEARTVMAGYDIATASSLELDPTWRAAFQAHIPPSPSTN